MRIERRTIGQIILLLLPTLALAIPAENVLIGKVVKVTDGDTWASDSSIGSMAGADRAV